jgi:radical SAM/Cys-rich protein
MSVSLLKKQHRLSDPKAQLDLLRKKDKIPAFETLLEEYHKKPLLAHSLAVLQINLGKMCNQVCKHCHVDAGPDRKEIMSKEVMGYCLKAIQNSDIQTIDLTGGAPEMNPHFRWFVEELSKLKVHIIVRCNLTIILANKKYHDLPVFFKKHQVEVVSSLPHFTSLRTDAQRGNGVFEQSIEALKLLNSVGYGMNESLKLNLVYNPTGTFLPGDQVSLEKEFKTKLKQNFDIDFNQLFTITNLPISRFLDYLVENEKYEEYLAELVEAFNPSAADGVMCRSMLSVSWDGFLYDCDFNQMLDLKLKSNNHIQDFELKSYLNRAILVSKHCFGCTAGAGSSCGGAVV